jgi:hypothetical protein
MKRNDFEKWLIEGDLSTDGRVDEVVDIVAQNPDAFEDVFACIKSDNPVVRGHTADALEKIGREHPDFFLPHIDEIITILEGDHIPMVQWHLAMLLGHLAIYPQYPGVFVPVLINLLEENQVFTQSWAITSLAIIAVLAPEFQQQVVDAIAQYENAPSAALSKRARHALEVLTSGKSFPKGWVKSPIVEKQIQQEN